MVVVPLPTNSWALQHIDLPKIEEYVDLVNLTAYDFSGPWRPTAGHHAQLYRAQEGENSGSAAVEYILATGFPAKKILLGIPVYGRSFIGAAAPGDQYHSNGGEDGIFEYKALPRPGTQEVVDTERCAAVCVGGDGGFVTYDNPETVAMKGRYCKEQGLGVSLPLLLPPMAVCQSHCTATDVFAGPLLLDWDGGYHEWPTQLG
jgi:chitinase